MGWGDGGSRMLYSLGVNEYSIMGGVSGSVGGVRYSVMFVILKPIGLCETNLRGEFLFCHNFARATLAFVGFLIPRYSL